MSLQSTLREQLGHGKFRDEQTDPQANLQVLRRAAKEEKSLLVLDDLWEETQFNLLNVVNDANGSRVLVTTRVRDVVPSSKTVDLSSLSEEEAAKLLILSAGLHSADSLNTPLSATAINDIARECGHLPLTVRGWFC